jgi:CDP-4-dehydro-6-deoxyglucose reductase
MAEKVARTLAVAEIAPDVLVVDAAFHTPPSLSWRPGQFVSIRCGEVGGDPDARRSYSIASSPARSDGMELLVKLLPQGAGSEFFRGLAPGGAIPFTGPMGFFTCELAHAGDAVFAATGTGIAAALPMIAETLARPAETGRVLLFWGMRDESELYWTDRLAALEAASPRFAHHVCLSRPANGWTGARGRINGHVLEALPSLSRPIFYLVGNGDMVRELKGLLVGAGVDRKRQIRTEVFYPETKAK